MRGCSKSAGSDGYKSHAKTSTLIPDERGLAQSRLHQQGSRLYRLTPPQHHRLDLLSLAARAAVPRDPVKYENVV